MSDPTTATLFKLVESDVTIRPSDTTGNVDDLTGDTGSTPALAVPAVAQGLLGNARLFGDDIGLIGSELVADSTRLRRDCTIAVIAEYDIASSSVSDECVLVARGVSGSAAERTLWGLKLVKLGTTLARLHMLWEESGGAEATVTGRQVTIPSSGFMLFWATRRWISAQEAIVRYGVNDQLLESVTCVDGDIDNGADGTLSIGCRGDGAGDYQDFFQGIIGQVWISDGVRSPEEMLAVYRRIAVHQLSGYRIVRSLTPPAIYSQNPESTIQRELMVFGDGLGKALAKVAELGEDTLPDRAWSMLERWEAIAGLPPKYTDSYAVRRARLISFFSIVHGYSSSGVQTALAEVMDTAAANIEILNYTNEYTDDFATALADYWNEVDGGGTIAISAGELSIDIATATDGRWETSEAPHVRQSIDGDALDADPAEGLDVTVKIASRTLADTSFAGLMAYDGITRNLLVLGHYNNAATYELRWGLYSNGAWAWTVIDNPAPALPTWLRMTFSGGTDWDLRDSQVSADEVVTPTNVVGIETPTWVGVGVITTAASPGGLSVMLFDDWRLYTPNGLRVFNWYAYRDTALSGTPDMPGARAIVRRMKPAETHACATETEGITCDDADSLCDCGPMGA